MSDVEFQVDTRDKTGPTDCECKAPGLCVRHDCYKHDHWFHLCQTRPDYFALWEQGRGPCLQGPPPGTIGLGDKLEQALAAVGVTKERVEEWVGRPCNCPERQQKLNQLGWWAERVMKGKIRDAKKYLAGILGDSE